MPVSAELAVLAVALLAAVAAGPTVVKPNREELAEAVDAALALLPLVFAAGFAVLVPPTLHPVARPVALRILEHLLASVGTQALPERAEEVPF